MKVILQRDIPKLGKGGDVVTVADGYARNYLFPRNYALVASPGALKSLAARAAVEAGKSAAKLQTAQNEAAKLQDLSLTIFGKVGNGTRLYGSITAQDLADEIKKATGVEVDKRRVGLADPIKTLGTSVVGIRLHNEVSVNISVLVTTEEEHAKRTAAEAAAAARAAEAEAAAAAAAAEA